MNRQITRTKDGRYCTVNIKLENDRFSITGEEGCVVTNKYAREEALEYWRSFFEQMPHERRNMNERCNTNFRTPLSAAKYVLRVDGKFHGLDATEMDDGTVRILESCGCIHDTLAEWFPEAKPLIPWHLNDMRAGCEHQEKLGWGHGKTIALTSDTLTDAQRQTIDGDLSASCERQRTRAFDARWQKVITNRDEAIRVLRRMKGPAGHITLSMLDDLEEYRAKIFKHTPTVKETKAFLKAEIEKEIPLVKFDAQIFKDSISAPCPECGYRYSTQWLKRELPPEIVKLAETVLA